MCRDGDQFDFLESSVERAFVDNKGQSPCVDRNLRSQMTTVGAMFSQIADAATVGDLAALFGLILKAEGFDQHLIIRSSGPGPQRMIARRQPPPFEEWHASNYGAHRDVMTDYAIAKGQPFAWIDAGKDGLADGAVQDYAEAALRLGLHNGLSLPVLVSSDCQHIFHLSSGDANLAIDDMGGLWRLVTTCLVMSQRLQQIEQAQSIVHEKRPNLSAREIDVLRWIKDGKSYAEIGQIMNISSKTVEFHIANALRKLGVTNRISAIIACSKYGFFDL